MRGCVDGEQDEGLLRMKAAAGELAQEHFKEVVCAV
jgi:hypothetical protein